jgi:GMP synthase-like glutamine amidotransferase
MKRFLAVQHTQSEFLGGIERELEGRDIGFVYCRPFTGQALPASALQYDALWLLGGAYPVTDREHCPWLDAELRLLDAFLRAQRPVVGLGFGALLLAHALGGAARAEPAHRAGWTVARKTAAGAGDPLAEAVDGARVLVMANGGVDAPAGAEVLLEDEAGGWIALRRGAAYGLLFRPELKPGTIEDMIMEEGRPLPEDIGALLATARAEWPAYRLLAERAVAALVAALDLMRERRKPPVIALRAVEKGR